MGGHRTWHSSLLLLEEAGNSTVAGVTNVRQYPVFLYFQALGTYLSLDVRSGRMPCFTQLNMSKSTGCPFQAEAFDSQCLTLQPALPLLFWSRRLPCSRNSVLGWLVETPAAWIPESSNGRPLSWKLIWTHCGCVLNQRCLGVVCYYSTTQATLSDTLTIPLTSPTRLGIWPSQVSLWFNILQKPWYDKGWYDFISLRRGFCLMVFKS